MYHHGMFAPILALIAWSFVMWLWLYVTRVRQCAGRNSTWRRC